MINTRSKVLCDECDSEGFTLGGVSFNYNDVRLAICSLENIIAQHIPFSQEPVGIILIGTDREIPKTEQNNVFHPSDKETLIISKYLKLQGSTFELPSVNTTGEVVFSHTQIISLQEHLNVHANGQIDEQTAKALLAKLKEVGIEINPSN